MNENRWSLNEPLQLLASVDNPYLKSARGRLGAHELEAHAATAPDTPLAFRVFLDGKPVFEQGLATPEGAWYHLCQELGYQADTHWDLDPALILFHQVLPALAREWGEDALPFNELGIPDGVTCLATVGAAWGKAVAAANRGLKEDPHGQAAHQVAACFEALALRAIVFHDDPGHREDLVGTEVDDPLLGIFLHFGQAPETRVTLAKGTLNATGGLKWSSWEPGGVWVLEGREFAATQGPADFLRAAGMAGTVAPGFGDLFQAQLNELSRVMDPVVEGYRHVYPGRIPWHRDARTRFLNHTIVAVRTKGDRQVLVLDDGSEVVVAEPVRAGLMQVVGEDGD